ncbi:MAG: nqo3 1 [Deltaproteobacteria bacterium]|nr:nqo3 1 [Deltaproteobacteria bacterium]
MPTLTINGIAVSVPEGTTILNAAKQAGIHIPHYCYHTHLSIAGNCRMCQVEVEKFPKLQTACSTVVTEGMVVRTDTEQVRKAVTGVLEFLLIHHPIDCPICDQAGECGLQDYYMVYGLHKSRYALGDKVHKKKVQDIGGQIILDAERCILCSRCVRFLDEVTGTRELQFFERGDHSEISIFPGRSLGNNYTGNLADICPVGALTSKDFRFKCRVWFLKGADSICTGCARGCNVTMHFKGDILYRYKPRGNEAVNRVWMCDFGRLEYKKANEDRLLVPFVRESGREKTVPWGGLVPQVAHALSQATERDGADAVAVIASPQSSNEELYLVRRIATELLGTGNLAFTHRAPGDGFSDDFLVREDKNPNSRGARLLGIPDGQAYDDLIGKIAAGKIRALLLFGNVLGACSDAETGELLSKVPFVAQVGTNAGPVSKAAHAVLPSASFAERSGTFTNSEGRVQRFHAGFPPRGKARNPIGILVDLAKWLGGEWSQLDERSVFLEMSRTEAPFRGMTYETIGNQGQEAGG